MISLRASSSLVVLTGALMALGGCSSEDSTGLDPDAEPPTLLLAVVPEPGATGVDRFRPVTVEFDHALMQGMEAYAVLHEGDVTGPDVPGVWSISSDFRTLTFTPDSPLDASTTYTIHVGGGMMDTYGHGVDLGTHGVAMGGDWATPGMMGGGMGGGMMGGALGEGHMGQGWQHPGNGSYGMVFSFVTGA